MPKLAVTKFKQTSPITHKLPTGTVLPYAWNPYPYQARALARYFGTDGQPAQTRHCRVWSRRLGKDRNDMETAALASQFRVMNIWHLFPLHKQCRTAIWNGIDPKTGKRFIDQTFPPDMVTRRSDSHMMLEFQNGSTYQMLGSDNYNAVVGSNPGLVIFSEYALSDPMAWTYVSPIIRANGGGALFNSTYRGKNHYYRLVQSVKDNPEWYVSFENIDTAKKDDGTPVVSREEAEKDLVFMDLRRWREEYENVPCVALDGAYFAEQLSAVDDGKRNVLPNLREADKPTGCAWFWAHSHFTWAVVFQIENDTLRLVNARRWEFADPATAMIEYEAQLAQEGITIDCHVLPEKAAEGVIGATTEDAFQKCKSGHLYTGLDVELHAGIDAARRMMPAARFGDAPGVADFFTALGEFRSGGQRIDEDNLTVSTRPVNDSGSVAAGALILLADFMLSGEKIRRERCKLDWNKRNIRRRFA